MKYPVMWLHADAVRKGQYGLARMIMKFLRDGRIMISDYNNVAYDSGFADWLMQNCHWFNSHEGRARWVRNKGFIALLASKRSYK